MKLSDQQFRQLLGEHVSDQRAEQALRDDRQALIDERELERVKVSAREDWLQDQLMEARVR